MRRLQVHLHNPGKREAAHDHAPGRFTSRRHMQAQVGLLLEGTWLHNPGKHKVAHDHAPGRFTTRRHMASQPKEA